MRANSKFYLLNRGVRMVNHHFGDSRTFRSHFVGFSKKLCFDSTEHCFTYNLSETQKVAEDYSKSTWLSLYPGTSRSKRTLKSICFIRCEAAAAADQHFSCFAVELGSSLAETGLFSF